MNQAVDSASRHTATSAAALAAKGIKFALRYHYNCTRDEIAHLHKAGVGFSLIAEFDTLTHHPPLHSPHLGAQHGRVAVGVARQMGMPDGCVIWFTADTFIGAGNYISAGRYFADARDVVRDAGYRCGAYGGSKFIDWMMMKGYVDLAWQCGASSWNENVDSRTACLEQLWGQPFIGGVQVDLNDIKAADCGAWMPDGAQRPDTPPPPPLIEDIMATYFAFHGHHHLLVAEPVTELRPKGFGWTYVGANENIRGLSWAGVANGKVIDLGAGKGVGLDPTRPAVDVYDETWQYYPVLNGPDARS